MSRRMTCSLLVVVLLLGSVLPVFADGAVSGSVLASNATPTITSVTLQASNKSDTVSSMDPLTEYVVEIVAGDNNTIDDIERIDIVLFYDDGGGADGDGSAALAAGWDSDEIAVYKWLKTDSTWSMENGAATTTWTLEANNDTPGTMTAIEGEWNLSFKPGKLAAEAAASGGAVSEWDIYVKVTDDSSATVENTQYTKAMTAYSELTMSDSATIAFGSLGLGSTAVIPDDHYITTQVIANDVHALSVSTGATWNCSESGKDITLDASGTPDAAGEFGLTIDDSGDGSGNPSVGQAVTSSSATITDHATVSRIDVDAAADETRIDTNFYMNLILASTGIDIGTYSGTITFLLTND